jgi:hypothetical protein
VALQRGSFRFVQFSQSNFIAAKIDDFPRDFAAAPVKDNKLLPDSHAQDVARVMRLRASQCERPKVPLFGRDVEAMHVI